MSLCLTSIYIHAYLLIYSIWLSTGIITNNIQYAFVSYLKAWTYTQWTSQLQIKVVPEQRVHAPSILSAAKALGDGADCSSGSSMQWRSTDTPRPSNHKPARIAKARRGSKPMRKNVAPVSPVCSCHI